MMQKLDPYKESPSQTAGPYVHIGCVPNFAEITGVYPGDLGAEMVNADTLGERISILVTVYDGTGTPLRDALIEIWQADARGMYPGTDPRGAADPNFTGWGRQPCDQKSGEFRFDTIKPGAVPFPGGGMMAPHITFWIVARGINIGLQTRMHFPQDGAAHAECPVLKRIEHRNRVPTLIAKAEGDGAYRFDVHLQGPLETVFFDV